MTTPATPISEIDEVLLQRALRILVQLRTKPGVHELGLSVSKLLESDLAQTKLALAVSERLADLSGG